MNPEVTIIIPVYNVEPYLRQCLDSVVNQTMREIQIICVNDGSPDGSRAILQEYANRDARIEIIDKPNGGLSSARNAAYPHIKGKYTLFVDSDDWIELDTCEKTFQKAEETGAPLIVFFIQGEEGQKSLPSFQQFSSCDITTVEEKIPYLRFGSVCDKLWRTDFLLGNQLYFPEGLVFEDNLVNWQAVTLADKISVIPEPFYHYRCSSGSITQTFGEHVMHIIPIFNKIHAYLLESGYYAAYRNTFISQKLNAWFYRYQCLPSSLKPKYVAMIRDSLTEDDRKFYRTALLKTTKLFYEMIDGGLMEAVKYHGNGRIRSIARMPERVIRRWIVKPLKKLLKAA